MFLSARVLLFFLSFPHSPLSPSPVFLAVKPHPNLMCRDRPLPCSPLVRGIPGRTWYLGAGIKRFRSATSPALVLLGRTSQSCSPTAVSRGSVRICVSNSHLPYRSVEFLLFLVATRSGSRHPALLRPLCVLLLVFSVS